MSSEEEVSSPPKFKLGDAHAQRSKIEIPKNTEDLYKKRLAVVVLKGRLLKFRGGEELVEGGSRAREDLHLT